MLAHLTAANMPCQPLYKQQVALHLPHLWVMMFTGKLACCNNIYSTPVCEALDGAIMTQHAPSYLDAYWRGHKRKQASSGWSMVGQQSWACHPIITWLVFCCLTEWDSLLLIGRWSGSGWLDWRLWCHQKLSVRYIFLMWQLQSANQKLFISWSTSE